MGQGSKSSRVLEIYQMLLEGRDVVKQDLVARYGVDARSIQRDINVIRNFLAEETTRCGVIRSIRYDKRSGSYRMVTQDMENLSEGEMLAICKILLESRAFSKEKVCLLVNKIMNMAVSATDRLDIKEHIANELLHYMSPAHQDPNPDFVWRAAQAIKEKKVLELTYQRLQRNEPVVRRVAPVGIIFSEFYFYLMCFIDDPGVRKDFDREDDPYPTIYRIDRIIELKETGDRYAQPYKDRFQEGDYKNRSQYMFGGELRHIQFQYTGPSLEAVLDRLPTAVVKSSAEGVHIISAEVFGKGILMWLLSQGSNVSVISPETLRRDWLREIETLYHREKTATDTIKI